MRTTIGLVIGAAAAAMLAGSALAAPLMVTPSGRPDALFPGMTADTAQAKIASYCMDKAMTVVSTSPGQVVCEAKMGMMQSVLSQMLIGNSYSTPPRQLIRFNVVSLGADARVQANAWIETQMAFGQMRQEALDGDKINDGLESILLGAGGSLPAGTRIKSGAAYLGFQGSPEVRNAGRSQFSVWPVKGFQADSPAKEAGVQIGDVITKVNGERVKGDDEMGTRLARMMHSGKPDFALTVERNGVEQTITVPMRERPALKVPTSLADLKGEATAGTP